MNNIFFLKVLVSSLLLFASATVVFCQTTPPPPPPPPVPQNTPVPTQTPYPQTYRVGMPMAGLNGVPNISPALTPTNALLYRQMMVQKFAQELYRKPTDKELADISPEAAIAKRYESFLDRSDTGIVKLVPDNGCAVDSKILDARPECLKYAFPGSGNSYSFRTLSYRIKHLADLTLAKGQLVVTGELMNGILVNVGDIPIERLTVAHPAMRFLADFRPVDDFDTAKRIDIAVSAGVRDGQFVYAKALRAEKDRTYLLRVVAYRGTVTRSIKGFAYDELDFDKRKDMTIAFRVVDVSDAGEVTLIWAVQQDSRSPKLKAPKVDLEAATKKAPEPN